ncbi:2-polyprenylphenol hydroxylase-like oxidoreductase [Candidatus Methanoperedens nitroreducens]|uniref:2-polyprenylphenol hydroxylase-like oxidoreductase n=1 Tax=Candidatus Methanoperedens nitratireducens TaxID=1392998 RepID=A0A062V358_9EURY|nr:FAD/NAD(P)-binding protein [Candidatus Methanoperedens nitroreducens]KCZ71792.1 2-polyprenylphenol hydroxylase-like oxidoreductase [Candidatus Methanoperedens nitroreducens]MDJ1422234.1 FAD/NAD(P)-binding protein [Candidatus Methanoperedens sp.]
MIDKAILLEKMKTSPYKPMKARIIEAKMVTENEKFFKIELEGKINLSHEPGQFVMVSIFGFGEAPISVCSSPTDKGFFDLTVRNVGMLTNALHKLNEGDIVGIRGPFGRGFPVDNMFGYDIVIVAGGLGIVPLRSLIRYIMHNRNDFGDVQILLGCRTPREFLFKEETKEWMRRTEIKFKCTVDRADPDWKGNVGLVTSLIPGVDINPVKTYAVVVGPPVMYKFVILKLLEKAIPDHQIIVSLERRMRCGLGKCGHCQIEGIYVCQSGPVFNYAQLKDFRGECHEGECYEKKI